MPTRASIPTTLTLVAVISLLPTAAHAQNERLRVSFGSAVTAGAIDSELALAGSVGYRFMDRISFELEVTSTESEDDRFPGRGFTFSSNLPSVTQLGGVFTGGIAIPGRPIPIPAINTAAFRAETEGHTLIALLGFRYELPSRGGRLSPYVNAGFGLARTEREFAFSILPALFPPLGPSAGVIRDVEESRMNLATGAGLGASVRVYKELSVDVDARYFRLDGDQHFGRFGGGVSYRF